MNKLISSAKFSLRDAKEQRLQEEIRHSRRTGRLHPADNWDMVAKAFHRYDPSGSKLAKLMKTVSS